MRKPLLFNGRTRRFGDGARVANERERKIEDGLWDLAARTDGVLTWRLSDSFHDGIKVSRSRAGRVRFGTGNSICSVGRRWLRNGNRQKDQDQDGSAKATTKSHALGAAQR